VEKIKMDIQTPLAVMGGTVDMEQMTAEQLSGANLAAIAQNKGKVVKRIAPIMQKKIRQENKIPARNPISSGSQPVGDSERAMFLNYLDKIEDGDLVAKIKDKKARVIRFILYSVFYMGSSTTNDLFSTARTKIQGLSNMNNAQLDKDNAFLVTGFQLQTGIGAGVTDADAKATAFGIPAVEVINGQFTFKVGTETFIERCSNQVFSNSANERKGLFLLDTPIMTNPGRDFSFVVDSGTTSLANTFGRIDIWGLMTMKK
jgi:hypothetical protein